MDSFFVQTTRACELLDLTEIVEKRIPESTTDAIVTLYVPHATAGVAVCSAREPAVARDLLTGLSRVAPMQGDYASLAGNSAAHIRALLVGHSTALPVRAGKLELGEGMRVYLCEFDGARVCQVMMLVQAAS